MDIAVYFSFEYLKLIILLKKVCDTYLSKYYKHKSLVNIKKLSNKMLYIKKV